MNPSPDIDDDDDEGVTHYIPEDEFREHLPSDECWCNPQPADDNDNVFIHNSECSDTIH